MWGSRLCVAKRACKHSSKMLHYATARQCAYVQIVSHHDVMIPARIVAECFPHSATGRSTSSTSPSGHSGFFTQAKICLFAFLHKCRGCYGPSNQFGDAPGSEGQRAAALATGAGRKGAAACRWALFCWLLYSCAPALRRQDISAGVLGSSGTSADADALRAALEEAESENEALRAELNAFDPKFFEEIEDLKHDHYVLSMKMLSFGETGGSTDATNSARGSEFNLSMLVRYQGPHAQQAEENLLHQLRKGMRGGLLCNYFGFPFPGCHMLFMKRCTLHSLAAPLPSAEADSVHTVDYQGIPLECLARLHVAATVA
eukprot:1161685-Pelagomonas_calceolata.AAC.23